MAIIKAQDPRCNGIRAGVMFKNGYGETSDERLVAWFIAHGYTVVPPKITPEQEKMLESMTDEALKDYIIKGGLGDRLGTKKSHGTLIKLAKEVLHNGNVS